MRRSVCFYVAMPAIAAFAVLAGLMTWREVAIFVLIAPVWYPSDRKILVAIPGLHQRRDQDTP
ncbi:hypothetical protein [Neoroseomonas lacus]|uniref:Uncharacterized protein n=1 Tax=Neoroseomonas lacus TaxID=287609 RepID=A0A917L2B1_9PROT|nr:hypothetical protein [Neoroseomonas lacus]GGJ36299.1 hypothetical protein GCM10011320_50050 [Neoroseomonas lacus]